MAEASAAKLDICPKTGKECVNLTVAIKGLEHFPFSERTGPMVKIDKAPLSADGRKLEEVAPDFCSEKFNICMVGVAGMILQDFKTTRED